ncbi:MAG: ABC transporter substrate-binding protein, partial [SAR324 cluster bacterium]|nr:ABC transporter substrate-binding protein [SAR324 cluster bacterium]
VPRFRNNSMRPLMLRLVIPALLLAISPIAYAASPPLVVMLEASPKTLDPIYATDAAGVRISHQLIFDTLLSLNDRLEIAPGLAESWRRSASTRYRLTLKKGVRFHDGTAMDARDVVHTLTTLMDSQVGSPYGSLLRDKIAAVRPLGSHRVEIELKAPYAAFLSDLLIPVRSRRAGKKNPLLGSGPFRFAGRSVNEIRLERNDGYHGPRAGVAKVVFKVVRDESTRLLKLRKGSVHLAVNVLPLDKLVRFQRNPLKQLYRVLEAPGLSYQYLGFNLRDPMLGNRKVRRAIAHAINVDVLIAHREKGHATRATGLLPGGSPYADPNLRPIPYDPALAARLLDEAGYPMRESGRFKLIYKTSTDRSAVIRARVIQSDLRKVGIEVEVRSYEWGTFYEDIGKGNFQMFSLRWIGVNDPDFYYELFHSSRMPPKGRNRGGYRNEQMDRLLEAGRLEGEPARRREIYRKIHRLLQEDLPYLSLWHNNNVAIVSRKFSGFRLHPTGGFQHLPAMRPNPP